YPELSQPSNLPPRRSEKLYGRALFPAHEIVATSRSYSAVWAYRWADARAALETMSRASAVDPHDGYILRYANPANGGDVLPTMGCRLQLLPRGFQGTARRRTTSSVYHVAEGAGYSVINGMRFDWEKGDTFAVPIWAWHEHASPNGEAVMFSFTDEPVLAPLGLARSENYPDPSGRQKVATVFCEGVPPEAGTGL